MQGIHSAWNDVLEPVFDWMSTTFISLGDFEITFAGLAGGLVVYGIILYLIHRLFDF